MRFDMHKVIVERPRVGRSRARPQKTGLRLNPREAVDQGEDFDGGAGRLLHPRRDKHFNEHLAPLRRYLEGQVNRPWAKVYSEICDGIDRHSVIGQHVLQHLEDFVQIHVRIAEDGKIYSCRCRFGWEPVRGLYVHPVTGLLRDSGISRRGWFRGNWYQPQEHEKEPDLVVLDGFRAYQKLNGLWFHVERRGPSAGAGGQELPPLKRALDRKTIRRIEAGECGMLENLAYLQRTGRRRLGHHR
jgi:hypothetical protein